MLKLRATIELNTPALGGGSEPRRADPYTPLRPSAVRGALRAWFRANLAGSLWPDRGGGPSAQRVLDERLVSDMRQIEARVFGSTSLRSSVVLAPPTGGRVEPWTPQPNPKAGLSYLGYGVFDRRAPPDRVVTDRRPFELSFSIRPRGEDGKDGRPPLPAEQVVAALASSLWLWCAFGGMGARWRRGFGSMRLRDLRVDGDLDRRSIDAFAGLTGLPVSHEAHLEGLQRGLGHCHDVVAQIATTTQIGQELLENGAVRPHPNIRSLAGIKTLRTLVPTADDPLVALDAAGTLLRDFRSSLERERPLPDYHTVKESIRTRRAAASVPRAAFGLPLGFFFRSLGDEKTRFSPTAPSELEVGKVDRVPSPLVMRVHALAARGRRPTYGVTLVNLAGHRTTPLLGCGLEQTAPRRRIAGTPEVPDAALLDRFIEHAVATSKHKPDLMAPRRSHSRARNRSRRR